MLFIRETPQILGHKYVESKRHKKDTANKILSKMKLE